MSSRISAAPLAFVVLLAASAAGAQENGDERNRKLQEKVDALCSKVEATVGVKFKKRVPAAYQSREDFAKFLQASLEKDMPKEEVEAITELYRLLNLFPAGFDLVATLTDMMKSQAAAYYDPETDRMFVLAADAPDILLESTLFHELVHAIQDQEHGLDKMMKALEDGTNDDAATAFRFLVEGEATFWEQKYTSEKMGQPAMYGMTKDFTTRDIVRMMDFQATMMGQQMPSLKEAAEQMKRLPPILVRSLTDAYLRGVYFAYLVHKDKGADGLRSIYSKPPTRTRDTMFASEWRKSPRPEASIKPAGLAPTLPKGWKMTHENTLGAITVHTMLESQKREANTIAKAWDGDRIQLWQDGKASFLIGLVAFASPETATGFAKQLERLYREEWSKGAELKEQAGDFVHLSAGDDRFAVSVKDRTLVYARGKLPKDPAAILEAFWKSEVSLPEAVKKP